MTDPSQMSRKVGILSGKLVELGQFGQKGAELQYAFVKVAHENGEVTTLPRVAIPGELNRLLEIDGSVTLFLARRGLWHFCYGVQSASGAGESYRGYRFFFIFNRLMMYLNLMFGVYLLMTPGIVWAGVGLIVFGLLFVFLGPASPRRMRALFAAQRPSNTDGAQSAEEKSGD